MIVAYYPSLHKPKPVKGMQLAPQDVPMMGTLLDLNYDNMANVRANKVGITALEWKRRDGIVKQKAHECKFVFGDTFYPCTKEGLAKYGRCVVTGKQYTYAEMEQDEWPTNDNPLIISARCLEPDKNNYVYICTGNYCQKEEPK